MRKTVTPLALALCGALAAPALADPTDALSTEAIALADAAEIPAEPLLKKIREGRAKGVPPARIRPAVQQLRDRLVAGRALCGADGDVLCITAAADAVASGARPDALTRMLEGVAAPAQRSRAFVAVATLGARGMNSEDAIGEVSRALAERRLDELLPIQATRADDPAQPQRAAPPGGGLPVQDAARDRDQTGNGNAWGRDKVKPDKPGKPDELTKTKKPKKPGRPDKVRGNNGNGNGNGNDRD